MCFMMLPNCENCCRMYETAAGGNPKIVTQNSSPSRVADEALKLGSP